MIKSFDIFQMKIEEIQQQSLLLSRKNEIVLRYNTNVQLNKCKAKKAESRILI